MVNYPLSFDKVFIPENLLYNSTFARGLRTYNSSGSLLPTEILMDGEEVCPGWKAKITNYMDGELVSCIQDGATPPTRWLYVAPGATIDYDAGIYQDICLSNFKENLFMRDVVLTYAVAAYKGAAPVKTLRLNIYTDVGTSAKISTDLVMLNTTAKKLFYGRIVIPKETVVKSLRFEILCPTGDVFYVGTPALFLGDHTADVRAMSELGNTSQLYGNDVFRYQEAADPHRVPDFEHYLDGLVTGSQQDVPLNHGLGQHWIMKLSLVIKHESAGPVYNYYIIPAYRQAEATITHDWEPPTEHLRGASFKYYGVWYQLGSDWNTNGGRVHIMYNFETENDWRLGYEGSAYYDLDGIIVQMWKLDSYYGGQLGARFLLWGTLFT